MKHAYTEKLRLSNANKERLHTVNNIINEYASDGYTLTLRQLYYQLVSRDVIPNKQAEYSKLGNLLVKGRMAGVVDWDAIEDRIRVPHIPYFVHGISDALNDTVNQYRLDRQDGQDTYIELWVEKDALSGVLKRVTDHYHIRLMVNRGYSSCTAMHDAAVRMMAQENNGKDTMILYLGDHDPSGLDMIRDIDERLEEFGALTMVRHIGITTKQIKEYNPPPNPAKFTDPRSKWYVDRYGSVSWEVDALPPKVLHELVESHVEEQIDMELFKDQIEKEEFDKAKLEKISEGIDE